MTARVCEWCGGPLKPNARPEKVTCSEAHRALRWRWLNGIPRGRGRGPQEPPERSPLWVSAPGPTRPPVAPVRTAPKRRKPSGLQVSFNRAVEVVAANLAVWLPKDVDPKAEAREVLAGALSARQRQRLDERQEVDQ